MRLRRGEAFFYPVVTLESIDARFHHLNMDAKLKQHFYGTRTVI